VIYLEPITYVLRIYADGDSFEKQSPYTASGTVQVQGDMAYIGGFSGTITRAQYRELLQLLAAMGINLLISKRRGKYKIRRLKEAQGTQEQAFAKTIAGSE